MIGKKHKSGFTLLELMFAVGIIALTLMAAITVIINALHLERQSTEVNTAKNAAEFRMQQLRGLNFLELLNAIDGTFDFTNDPNMDVTVADGTVAQGNFSVVGLRPQDQDPDGQIGWFEVRKHAGAVGDNLVDLTVRVQWRGQRGGDQQFELLSMRSDRGMRWQEPGN